MSVYLGYSNRVRYAFIHGELGYQEISEPRNWKTDEKEFARVTKDFYAGVFGKLSAEIEFTGTGRDFILQVYSAYGANTDLRLLKEAQDSKTDEWYRVWDGQIDMTTLVQEDKVAKAKFNAESLHTIIKSRQSEKYEIEREEDLFGNIMDPMSVEIMELKGRKILLESLLKVPERLRDGTKFDMNHRTNDTRYSSLALPMTVDYSSDEFVTPPFEGVQHPGQLDGTTGLMFYLTNDRQKLLNMTVSFSFEVEVRDINNLDNPFFEIQLVKYGNGANFDVLDREVLYADPNPRYIAGRQVDYTGSFSDYELLPNESLGLIIFAGAYGWGTLFENGDLRVTLNNLFASVSISEDSFVEPSQANVILPYETLDRLMTIITGRTNAFYSEALGRTELGYEEDGFASLCGLSHGHWKRGFVKGDDLYKPFTTSIKHFMQSYGAVWGLAAGIEKIGFQERLRVEKKEFFYNRNVTIRLGKYNSQGKFVFVQVNNLKRMVDADSLYSEIKVGTETFEEYEEIQGLDEFNAQSTFATVINKINNVLSITSEYRRDATGGEIARRLSKALKPTEDTKYDEKIFMEDLKRSATSVFQQRKWQDDFDSAPSGIFDPDTATNLRLSQVRMLLRHGWHIASCVIKAPFEFIRFTSTLGNANLRSKLTGEDVFYKENQDIPNSDLERAIHEPDIIEFEYAVNDELLAKLDGTTEIFGELVQNKYGLVEFMNEKGQIERGHLESLKPNGVGQWTLKKYYNLN